MDAQTRAFALIGRLVFESSIIGEQLEDIKKQLATEKKAREALEVSSTLREADRGAVDTSRTP